VNLFLPTGKTMLLQKKQFCLIGLLLLIALMPCACSLNRISPEKPSRVYHKPYDEVWGAVTGVVFDDLGCVDRKLKKNKGYLETEWVHNIDTTGQHRWKIEVYLKKNKETITVQLNKIMQLKDSVSKTINKYNKNQKDNEPVGPHAGWSSTAAADREIEELYRKIDMRLGK
jgi:hypothetical protein